MMFKANRICSFGSPLTTKNLHLTGIAIENAQTNMVLFAQHATSFIAFAVRGKLLSW